MRKPKSALMARLEALTPKKVGAHKRRFTREEDAAILAHWERLGKAQLAEAIGVSEGTLRKHYRELTSSRASARFAS